MNDDPNLDDAERRLRDAISAETEPVRGDEYASLAAIRERAAGARRRRLVGATALGAAAALVIGIAIGASVGDDGDNSDVATEGPSTTTTTTPCPSVTSAPTTYVTSTSTAPASGAPLTSVVTAVPDSATVVGGGPAEECADSGTTTSTTTTTAPITTTTVANPELDIAYPFNGQPGAEDPAAVARAFLEELGVPDPPLGAFEPGGPDFGEIKVHAQDEAGQVRTDITRSTLFMGKVQGRWVVRGASTESITYGAMSISDTKLVIEGTGRGYEGTLHVQVIGHGDVDFRRTAFTTASGDIELRPYTVEVDVTGSSGQVATVIIANEGGDTGGPSDFLAFTVELA